MSAAAYSEPTPVLTAQRGGLAPTAAPVKMHPSEIALTLSADVLRLPYQPSYRLVLAEVLSLYAANDGCCDASDPHFAARLSINKDTVSVALAKFEADGLISRVTTPTPTGKYRRLTPNLAAIAAKAATNPYPKNAPNPRRNIRLGHAGISGDSTPEYPAIHAGISGDSTPEKPESLAGISGVNIPLNLPLTYHTPTADAVGAGIEKKIEGDFSSTALPAEAAVSAPRSAAPPAKTRRRAERPAPVQAEPLPESCPLADLLNPPGDAHRVQQLAEPLTQAQAERLLHDYPEAMVRDILCQMANWQPLLTKATSANLTARNWLTKRANEAPRPARPAAAPAAAAPVNPAGQVTKRLTVIEQTLADRQARRQQTP
jgi:DNA-binding MarR family transcriptional regulator